LQILQDADWSADLGFERADRGVDLRMILVCAVAEIHAERVDNREEQGLQHGRLATCRTHSCNDLGTSIAMHGAFSLAGRLK